MGTETDRILGAESKVDITSGSGGGKGHGASGPSYGTPQKSKDKAVVKLEPRGGAAAVVYTEVVSAIVFWALVVAKDATVSPGVGLAGSLGGLLVGGFTMEAVRQCGSDGVKKAFNCAGRPLACVGEAFSSACAWMTSSSSSKDSAPKVVDDKHKGTATRTMTTEQLLAETARRQAADDATAAL